MTSEAEFTQPRPECPRPSLWSAHDTDSAEIEVSEFLHGLVRLLKPRYVLETGSCYGFSTYAIGTALAENHYGRCVSLEIDRGRAELATKRCLGLPVEVVIMESLRYPNDPPPDLAFFDSDMSIRLKEWERFKPRFAVMHDTGDHRPEVQAQILELVDPELVAAVFMPTPRGLALLQRMW